MPSEIQQLTETLSGVADSIEEFKKKYDEKLQTEVGHREEVERKLNALRTQGTVADAPAAEHPERLMDVKSGKLIPVLSHKMRVADFDEDKKAPAISVGRMLRGIVLGGHAHDAKEIREEFKDMGIAPDSSGGYTVPHKLSSQWIDALRAKMVLSQAGAQTVPMETNSLGLAKLTGDITTEWHGENASINNSDASFGLVTLNSKTVIGLAKLSLELAQDSANIDEILQSSLTSALANAIDSAGLVGVTTNAAAAPGGIFDLTNRNTVTAIGAPTSWDFLIDGVYELLADNVPQDQIGAMIAHPKLWRKMAKLKTGLASDNTPLPMPEEVAKLPKLWTTAAPLAGGTTAKAAVANWKDLLFGVRKQITVKVLSERYMPDNLQIAVLAYARCDFVATRAQSFCTLEGITV